MKVAIRRFCEADIENKVRWINDPRNNTYLHYDLPLEVEKTRHWFQSVKDRRDRYDAVIEADGEAVGLIGLLSIDSKRMDAEYYVCMGEERCKGKGIARAASELLLTYAFEELRLARVYLFTETENFPAQRLFRRIGFAIEGVREREMLCRGREVSRFVLGMSREAYYLARTLSPVQELGELAGGNRLFVKREDLIPVSFGGNKARKATLFFEKIDRCGYDCVVSYGGSHSNHCRVVANLAAARNLPCVLIGPEEVSDETFNSRMMRLFGAKIVSVPVQQVHDTIEQTLQTLREQGKNPYFIQGGGHGNLGTEAYVRCYEEIRAWEAEKRLRFDFIFLASGTGTTQAGLICGQLLHGDARNVVGISIARKNPRGRNVVLESVRDYLTAHGYPVNEDVLEKATVFLDDYTGDGYGKDNPEIDRTIRETLIRYGLPLDSTYTGKAFTGMERYLTEQGIKGKNILFLHTGGTPLFFDDLMKNE